MWGHSITLTIATYLIFIQRAQSLKVGIIGGGIGGTSAAYFLHELFGKDVDITLFEAKSIGGRLSTAVVGGKKYESGGSILIPRNRYMTEFLDILDLQKRKDTEGGFLSLFDGKQTVFAESQWKIVNIANLIWRYGFDLYSLNRHIDSLLQKFERIYDQQADLAAFANVTALMRAMSDGFVGDLSVTAEEGFTREGFSKHTIDELIAASLRVNYGQDTNVQKFVGSVSVAAASGGLWSVEGGNQRVPELLAKKSKAKVLMRTVSTVTRLPSGGLAVDIAPRGDLPIDDPYEFDVVIIAAPQTEDMPQRLSFNGFSTPIEFQGRYHRTVCTILRGSLRHETFPGCQPYTDEVLATSSQAFFNSVGKIYPVDSNDAMNGSNVWKVFTEKPLQEEDFNKLFSEWRDPTVIDWLAYPEYESSARHDSFVLSENLYHINAIEWAASAMEMSAIGAKNVANLVRQQWCLSHQCTPTSTSNTKPKQEL